MATGLVVQSPLCLMQIFQDLLFFYGRHYQGIYPAAPILVRWRRNVDCGTVIHGTINSELESKYRYLENIRIAVD